ncbi:hypothetical protein IEQ34_002847 [Dendrobium chrysotoxum]|uniref:Uncharacterized protein n=1 Tax=Dendrobium chrysotoxum TaxID=161865 RepID=A0AAV7HI39_DENCH|nr:hypothetical protein IEQ34_002847 [Dendrobium chrysotoxum]
MVFKDNRALSCLIAGSYRTKPVCELLQLQGGTGQMRNFRHNKLLKARNEDWPPPKQPEVAPMLVIQTLYIIVNANFKGFLAFYGLPYVPQTIEEDIEVTTTRPEGITLPFPEGVQFELLTLPVDKRAIGDGDGFTAYWQKEASDARTALWALPDLEKPQEWRRNNPNPREHRREATILFTDSDSVGNTRITKY